MLVRCEGENNSNSYKVVMELGFDAIAAVQALVESKNDADKVCFLFFCFFPCVLAHFLKATMLVVNKPSAYEASKKQLEALSKLTKFYSPAMSAAALLKCKNNIDDAFAMCKDKPSECFKLPGTSKSTTIKGKMVKKNAGGNKQVKNNYWLLVWFKRKGKKKKGGVRRSSL